MNAPRDDAIIQNNPDGEFLYADSTASLSLQPPPPNNITFWNSGPENEQREVLRFETDGRVFVRGEQVDDNLEIYAAFLRWGISAGAFLPEAYERWASEHHFVEPIKTESQISGGISRYDLLLKGD